MNHYFPYSPYTPIKTGTTFFLMFSHFTHRATEEEIMDDLSLQGEELDKTLANLGVVNRWLGSHLSVRSSVRRGLSFLSQAEKEQPLRLIDVGCGGGDSLRMLAKWSDSQDIDLQLTGLDANPHIISWAKKESAHLPAIDFLQGNVLEDEINWEDYDLVLCGLFLHHFSEEEHLYLLEKWRAAGIKLILVYDLQRSWLPYLLFQLTSRLLRFTPMARADGALSVRRGFHRRELIQLMTQFQPKAYQCWWRWAFQYQLIVVP